MFRGSFRGGGGGSGVVSVVSIDSADSPYSLPLSSTVLAVDSSAGVVNVNLPAASSSEGIIYYVKNTAGATSNRVRVLVSSGTIDGDGETQVDLENDKSSVTLVSDGSNYLIIG
tara:strand:- start:15287 stop:15628 length:342 start_codon:yes stop_codon:yes gene_type:complete